MNQDASPGPQEVAREQAAAWFARVQDGPLSAERQAAFEAWLAQDPLHREEYEVLTELWRASDLLPQARLEALCVEVPIAVLPRRRFVRQALAAAVMVVAAGLGWFTWQDGKLNHHEQLQTGLGERRQVELPDGSRLEINGRTRLEVRFSAAQRDIRLEQGEVMFSVAHDHERPFVVDTGNGTVTVTGTRFDVRRDPGQARVVVEQGSVRVQGHRESQALLSAGLGSHIDEEGNVAAAYQVDPAALTAWRSGKLVFNDASLAQVAEEVSRYRPHPLHVAPKVAKLRLSSTFRVDDTDALLRALPSILPVAVVARADGSQEIIAK